MNSEKLLYFIALQMVPGVGPSTSKNLIAYCGSPESVFTEKKNHLLKIPGVGPKTAEGIISFRDFARAEKEIDFISRNNIRALTFLDKDYPHRLLEIDDAPVVLYMKGNADLNAQKMIGIVGTRRATEYGKRICSRLVEGLKDYNATIVSGLAYGIDHCAHKNALTYDLPTIGVLGHGLDTIYPASHRAIANEMMMNGAVLSEYISETIPDKPNFPERNRIVAGMVDGLVVVESGVRGGALITAEIAFSYNRDVFAVPGKVDDDVSSGCNRFIKLNKAYLIESANDLAYHLGWDIKSVGKEIVKPDISILNPVEKELVGHLGKNGKVHIDKLAVLMNRKVSELSVMLIELEFNGYIQAVPGSFYTLI